MTEEAAARFDELGPNPRVPHPSAERIKVEIRPPEQQQAALQDVHAVVMLDPSERLSLQRADPRRGRGAVLGERAADRARAHRRRLGGRPDDPPGLPPRPGTVPRGRRRECSTTSPSACGRSPRTPPRCDPRRGRSPMPRRGRRDAPAAPDRRATAGCRPPRAPGRVRLRPRPARPARRDRRRGRRASRRSARRTSPPPYPLTELAGPRWRIEAGEFSLKLLAEHGARLRTAAFTHNGILTGLLCAIRYNAKYHLMCNLGCSESFQSMAGGGRHNRYVWFRQRFTC